MRALAAVFLPGWFAVGCAAQSAPAAAERGAGAAAPAVEVTFLDVGQGDAVLVRAPEGQAALIDAGTDGPVDALAARGVARLDLLVATHPHADHIGGMVDVLAAMPVRYFMDNGQPHTTVTYRNLIATLERRTDVTYLAADPRTVRLGSVTLEVLPLPPPEVDLNNRSVALVLRFGAFVALLSGDSEIEELEWLLARDAVPDVALLKAAHHGSGDGFTEAFLERARPEVVVVSVGRNSYGHPHADALAAYRAHSRAVYRTDLQGSVTVRGYADGHFDVSTDPSTDLSTVRARD